MKQKKVGKMNLKAFEKYFQERKTAILNPIVKEAVVVDGGDEVDVVQSFVLNDMAERLSSRGKTTLAKINEALLRIKDGTFGICEECDEEIGEKRLLAVPDCSSCIGCAERQEKLARQYAR